MMGLHVVLVAAVALSTAADVCNAGASWGAPGHLVNSAGSETLGPAIEENRHQIALEYAFADPIVRSGLEEFAIKELAMQGIDKAAPGVKEVTALILEIKKAAQLTVQGSQQRLNVAFVNTIFRSSLEAALIPAKMATPGLSESISVSKIAVAFTTAYVWGYFHGQ